MANQQGGRRTLERFRLIGVCDTGTEIGRGSYAAVVELQFRGLKCAGKKVFQDLYNNVTPLEQQSMLQRFEDECELLSGMRHPNIVQFLGVNFEEGSHLPTLVMEFLHTTLSACLDRYSVLPQEISYSILDDVAIALCYLHGNNPAIIHRDLTANNVLLTSNMTAKISDLGVAKILNVNQAQRNQMTICPGTLAYMPPDALEHNPTYTTDIDCFSYGVLMLHMFCGRWPLPGEPNRVDPQNSQDLIPRNEAERREEFLNELGNQHPLIELIRQCLKNNREHRPNAEEILGRVREAAAQHPHIFEDKVEQQRTCAEEKHLLHTEIENKRDEIMHKDHEIKILQMNNDKLLHWLQAEEQVHSLQCQESQRRLSEVLQEKERLTILSEMQEEEIQSKTITITAKNKALSYLTDAQSEELATTQRELKNRVKELSIKEEIIHSNTKAIEEIKRQRDEAMAFIKSKSDTIPHLLNYKFKLNWKRVADFPQKSFNPYHCTVIGSTLYTAPLHEKAVYRYSTSHDVWTVLPQTINIYFGLGHLLNQLITVGGSKEDNTLSGEVFTYDEEKEEWMSIIPRMPTPRKHVAVASHDSAMAVIGGTSIDSVVSAVVEVYQQETCEWNTASPLKYPVILPNIVVNSDYIYCIGGLHPEDSTRLTYSDLKCYCQITNISTLFQNEEVEWKGMPNIPYAGSGVCSLNGALLSIGGFIQASILVSRIYAFSNSLNSWICIGRLPENRVRPVVATMPSGDIIVVGGCKYIEPPNVIHSQKMYIGTLDLI